MANDGACLIFFSQGEVVIGLMWPLKWRKMMNAVLPLFCRCTILENCSGETHWRENVKRKKRGREGEQKCNVMKFFPLSPSLLTGMITKAPTKTWEISYISPLCVFPLSSLTSCVWRPTASLLLLLFNNGRAEECGSHPFSGPRV